MLSRDTSKREAPSQRTGPLSRVIKKHGFRHVTKFASIQQLADSLKNSFYALHQLKGMVRDAEMIKHPDTIREWSARYAGDINDADLREDFHRIQVKLSQIIIEDVNAQGGGLKSTRKGA